MSPKKIVRCLTIFLGLCFFALQGTAQEMISGVLSIEPTNVFDKVNQTVLPIPSKKEFIDLLKNEANYVLSGIVYGFDFEYEPLDRARNRSEQFTLTPIATLNANDPAINSHEEKNTTNYTNISLRFNYTRAGDDAELRTNYTKLPWVSVQGSGTSERINSDFLAERRAAYKDALRLAVRNYLISISKNKPARARGQIILRDFPILQSEHSQYRAIIKAYLKITELKAFDVY